MEGHWDMQNTAVPTVSLYCVSMVFPARGLTGCILMPLANLKAAYLRGADLRGANLREANLQEANLLGADLTAAYLRGANLLKSKSLTIEQLCEARTLYQAMLDDELKKKIKEKSLGLLEEPKH